MGKIITVPKPRDISFHMTINGAQVSSENSFESFLMDALDYGGPQDDKKEIRKARKVYEKLQTSEETKPDTLVLEDFVLDRDAVPGPWAERVRALRKPDASGVSRDVYTLF